MNCRARTAGWFSSSRTIERRVAARHLRRASANWRSANLSRHMSESWVAGGRAYGRTPRVESSIARHVFVPTLGHQGPVTGRMVRAPGHHVVAPGCVRSDAQASGPRARALGPTARAPGADARAISRIARVSGCSVAARAALSRAKTRIAGKSRKTSHRAKPWRSFAR